MLLEGKELACRLCYNIRTRPTVLQQCYPLVLALVLVHQHSGNTPMSQYWSSIFLGSCCHVLAVDTFDASPLAEILALSSQSNDGAGSLTGFYSVPPLLSLSIYLTGCVVIWLTVISPAYYTPPQCNPFTGSTTLLIPSNRQQHKQNAHISPETAQDKHSTNLTGRTSCSVW